VRLIRCEDDQTRVQYAALSSVGPVRIAGDPFDEFEVTAEPVQIRKLLTPVVPTEILAIGRNYPSGDTTAPDYPIAFMKSAGSVQDPGQPIVLPRVLASDKVVHEGELAVIVGRRCRDATSDTALDYVLGYACANDVTALDWQERCAQWWRGKSFDTFTPMGPCVVLQDEIPDPSRLIIRSIHNGRVTHEGRTADMIFDVRALIAFLSADTTLSPGTVILTGSPARTRDPDGGERLEPGDEVIVEIEGIGRLVSPVAASE